MLSIIVLGYPKGWGGRGGRTRTSLLVLLTDILLRHLVSASHYVTAIVLTFLQLIFALK